MKFTATGTSQELVLAGSAVTDDASILVDDVSVVQDPWVETGTELSPGTVPGEDVVRACIAASSGTVDAFSWSCEVTRKPSEGMLTAQIVQFEAQ